MIGAGFTYVLLLVLLNGKVLTVQMPEGTTEIQCKYNAQSAPQELRSMVQYAKCVKQYPST